MAVVAFYQRKTLCVKVEGALVMPFETERAVVKSIYFCVQKYYLMTSHLAQIYVTQWR